MNVPAFLYLDEKLEELVEDKTVQQTMNMATLPGILDGSIAMPDAHMGYGFPVGGVAALDADDGVISPGGIGFDINCGVRLLRTDLHEDDVRGHEEELLEALYNAIPAGVGKQGELRLNRDELDELLARGPEFLVEGGYGTPEDVELCESQGKMDRADPDAVTRRAKSRGRKQVGTLGGGNHFLEIQYVDEAMHEAEMFGLERGQVVVMIHTGSRGLGHQVCSDYLRKMEDAFPDIIDRLPEKDLAYAPIGSALATEYYEAMCAAAHFAWSNRHFIAHQVRCVFEDELGAAVEPVYDVAHNIAKLEEHELPEGSVEAYVHRKGATRAYPPGHEAVPSEYREAGQPVLIPGSMGTGSYVLAGREASMYECFGSTCHGAGRVMSRTEAKQRFDADGVKRDLAGESIYIRSASKNGVTEEAPGAYKDVDDVIRIVEEAGIAESVARLRPMGVIKG